MKSIGPLSLTLITALFLSACASPTPIPLTEASGVYEGAFLGMFIRLELFPDGTGEFATCELDDYAGPDIEFCYIPSWHTLPYGEIEIVVIDPHSLEEEKISGVGGGFALLINYSDIDGELPFIQLTRDSYLEKSRSLLMHAIRDRNEKQPNQGMEPTSANAQSIVPEG